MTELEFLDKFIVIEGDAKDKKKEKFNYNLSFSHH